MILGGVTDAGALAAVDCGTNSTRLLVVGSAGDVRAREMTITRLGEGVDATHRLRPEAMERTFAALRAYRSIMDAERVGRARLVATSAVRDAANGEAFLLPAAEIVGAPAELLPGQEEGRLSYAGATADLPVPGRRCRRARHRRGLDGDRDQGRGRDPARVSSTSAASGSRERFLRGDPPTAPEVAAAVQAIGAELDRAAERDPAAGGPAGPRDARRPGRHRLDAGRLELGLAEYDRERIHHAVLDAGGGRALVRRPGRRTRWPSGPPAAACPRGDRT